MIKKYLFLYYFIALVYLNGCAGYQDAMRSCGQGLGATGIRDIQQANAYRKILPTHLGLPPSQLDIAAGSGVTDVTISGVNTSSEKDRITAAINTLNAKNPQLNPLRLRFQ